MTDVKAIRTSLGLTQAQLGELLGFDQSWVSRMERDEELVDPRTKLALEALIQRQQAAA